MLYTRVVLKTTVKDVCVVFEMPMDELDKIDGLPDKIAGHEIRAGMNLSTCPITLSSGKILHGLIHVRAYRG